MSSSDHPGSANDAAGSRVAALPLDVTDSSEPLRACVKEAVESYLRDLDGHDVSDLFDLVMAEVEAPLLETVLMHAKGNQSRTAAMLGINRATLRKKLKRYDLV